MTRRRETLDLKVNIVPGRKREYYWENQKTEESEDVEVEDNNGEPSEEELYDPLMAYLESEWELKAKRIRHGKSSHRQGR